MRIAIIAAIGILSFLIIVLPGYFFIVPRDADTAEDNQTMAEMPLDEALPIPAKTTSAVNPGMPPLPKLLP